MNTERTVTASMDPQGYVVEHEGMLRTGPFSSPEKAIRWYAEELDLELHIAREEGR